MLEDESIPIYVPTQYITEVLFIIETGIKESNLPRETKDKLKYWLEVEKSIINDTYNQG